MASQDYTFREMYPIEMTIGEVKWRVAAARGAAISELYVKWKGKILADDSRTLYSYGVSPSDQVLCLRKEPKPALQNDASRLVSPLNSQSPEHWSLLEQQEFLIDADPAETILDVKMRVAARRGINLDKLKLICSGKILADYRTVASYGIKPTDRITCMIANSKPQHDAHIAPEKNVATVTPMQAPATMTPQNDASETKHLSGNRLFNYWRSPEELRRDLQIRDLNQATIADIKQKLAADNGVDATKLTLMSAGKTLADTERFSSYDIKPTDFIGCAIKKPIAAPGAALQPAQTPIPPTQGELKVRAENLKLKLRENQRELLENQHELLGQPSTCDPRSHRSAHIDPLPDHAEKRKSGPVESVESSGSRSRPVESAQKYLFGGFYGLGEEHKSKAQTAVGSEAPIGRRNPQAPPKNSLRPTPDELAQSFKLHDQWQCAKWKNAILQRKERAARQEQIPKRTSPGHVPSRSDPQRLDANAPKKALWHLGRADKEDGSERRPEAKSTPADSTKSLQQNEECEASGGGHSEATAKTADSRTLARNVEESAIGGHELAEHVEQEVLMHVEDEEWVDDDEWIDDDEWVDVTQIN